jgi:hypothetical protein
MALNLEVLLLLLFYSNQPDGEAIKKKNDVTA